MLTHALAFDSVQLK